MSFSVVPLLLVEEEIPLEVRRAVGENRLQEAAALLMREYGLSCIEASDLLDIAACKGEGATVIMAGRSKPKLQRARESIQSSSGNKGDVVMVVADLGTAAGIRTMIDSVPDVDILVNNLFI